MADARLVGFVLNRMIPLPTRFYCLPCMQILSDEKSWSTNVGDRRKGAVPLVRFGGGAPTCLRVPASNVREKIGHGQWPIEDDRLSREEVLGLQAHMMRLGLRIVPSMPLPEPDRRCKNCRVHVMELTGHPLADMSGSLGFLR